jgi:ABC-2 type transport system permease protein
MMTTNVSRAFSSEILKARPLRRVAPALLMALTALAASLTVATAGDENTGARPGAGSGVTADSIASSAGLGQALAGAADLVGAAALCLAAWIFGQEFTNRTLPGLFIRMPRRIPFLAGKLAAVVAMVMAAALAACVVGVCLAAATAASEGIDTSPWWSGEGWAETLAAAGRLILVAGAWATLGACLALVLRAPAPAIGLGLVYALPGELLLTAAWSGGEDWLPGSLLGKVADGGDSLGRAALIVALEIAVLMGVSVATFLKRETRG